MNPKILAILPGLIPSTIINVTTPLMHLHKTGLVNLRVTLEMLVKGQDIDWSDLIIFCRNVEPSGNRWLLKALENNIPYIYDIDDNLFELPVEMSVGEYHSSPERLIMLQKYILHANLVRVYSVPMLDRAKSLNPATVKVNGYVDWKLVNASKKKKEGPVKIVYATSRTDDNLAEIFKLALKKILERYRSQIKFFFLGYNPAEFKTYPNVFFEPINLNYEKYMRHFSSSGFDIGLAPLYDDVFHRSKTNLKVREYGACRIAGIYSDVDTYSTSIVHKKNGLLVKNSQDEWFNAMSVLIEDQGLRLQIQNRAYQFALENFSQESFTQRWYTQIGEVLNAPVKKNDSNRIAQHQRVKQFKLDTTLEDISIQVKRDLWLSNVFLRLISGIRSKGVSFLISYVRMKIQMLWVLLKIKFSLD